MLETGVAIKSNVRNKCYNKKIVSGTSVAIKSSVRNKCCYKYNK
jgi:hypothetical protein